MSYWSKDEGGDEEVLAQAKKSQTLAPCDPAFGPLPQNQKPQETGTGSPSARHQAQLSAWHTVASGCVHHTAVGYKEHMQGGDTGTRWRASYLPITANKYANDKSRNALLTSQFNSSNPGGKSL